MTTAHATSLLVAGGSAGLALLVRVATLPLQSTKRPTQQVGQVHAAARVVPVATDSTGARLVTRDPFRITRRPAPLVYDPLRAGQPAPPPSPRPSLVLDGIVWDGGRSPTALLEGLPGVEGPRVVRTGDVVGALLVKDIRRDHVLVADGDTAWTLTVREPWK